MDPLTVKGGLGQGRGGTLAFIRVGRTDEALEGEIGLGVVLKL